ncbi:MAG: 5,10-methylenetetrahydrofolate reductase, partial [Actinobacteria bacterium]|nr:5,10-methylenetetrahydrofolate reductase [Actinomycetota bacterium]NIV59005.1 5,10-methylenetetrahydrofolate reductase [Actinomycetota bacterium]
MAYELVPLKNLPGQIEHLPDEALVSVTASPVKTLDDSLDVCADLIDRGHRPIPHLAARMVEDPEHLKSLARRIKDLGIRRIF